jgi:acetolactate synthase-1/2/3 large subunit
MTGAELFAASLRVQGIEWVSALCGNGLNDLLAACDGAGIRVVDTRNEQAAAYMADAWGRLSSRPGVCLVSSGVAHVNALGGVTNAWFDGAPMLLVSGAGPLGTAGMGHFQDLDQVTLAAPVCKYARVIDSASRVAEFVHQAFTAALHGRPGPVHLTFPMDAQAASAEGAEPWPRVTRSRGGRAAPEQLDRLVALLAASRRPLIVCGSGAYHAGAEQALAEFSAAFGVPVVVPIWDRGAIPAGMTEYVGVIGAATGGPELLGDADLIMLLGAEVDYRVGYLASPPLRPGTPVVQVDADPARLGRRLAMTVEIAADPSALLTDLQEACIARRLEGYEDWLTEARARRGAFTRAVVDGAARGDGKTLHALDILAVLERHLTEEAVLIVDGGNIGQWFHHTLGSRQYPGHWLTCGASAVIGFGIPAAMAARVGFPRRPVVVLSGDGSATFTVAELERAVGQGLPFVFIVADDERWGIVESGQSRRYGRPLSSLLGPVDFAGLARSLGALGTRVESCAELEAALRQGLRERVPAVIHVPVVGGMPAA